MTDLKDFAGTEVEQRRADFDALGFDLMDGPIGWQCRTCGDKRTAPMEPKDLEHSLKILDQMMRTADVHAAMHTS